MRLLCQFILDMWIFVWCCCCCCSSYFASIKSSPFYTCIAQAIVLHVYLCVCVHFALFPILVEIHKQSHRSKPALITYGIGVTTGIYISTHKQLNNLLLSLIFSIFLVEFAQSSFLIFIVSNSRYHINAVAQIIKKFALKFYYFIH